MQAVLEVLRDGRARAEELSAPLEPRDGGVSRLSQGWAEGTPPAVSFDSGLILRNAQHCH